MKQLKSILLVAALVVFVSIVSMIVLRNTLIKFVLEHGIKSTTGVGMQIQKLHIGLLKPSVEIRGLTLHNPRGFHEKIMMSIPEATIEIKPGALLWGRVHIPLLTFHLAELVVIKNAKGKTNIDALKPVKEGESDKAKRQREKQATATREGKETAFQLDYVKLTIGKGIYKDYSGEGEPKVREFNLNMTKEYKGVRDPSFLISILVTEVVARTAIAGLSGVDVSGANIIVKDSFKIGTDSVGGAVTNVVDSIKGLFNK